MKNETKKKFLSGRVTDEEHSRILALAFASGKMDISDYVRRCALLGIVFKVEAKVPDEVQILVESMTFEKPTNQEVQKQNKYGG